MRAMLMVCLVAGAAHADVDWARGLVTAEGVGIADRHAPNPAVARGTSRRGAEAAARAVLATSVRRVPVAGGGTVGDKAKPELVDRAVANAFAIDAQPETDGAWRVTMAVPIEALRQAIAGGARKVPASGDTAVPVQILDGGHPPAIGAAPTIWVKALPAWAKDAPHVSVPGPPGPPGNEATLYVVVLP